MFQMKPYPLSVAHNIILLLYCKQLTVDEVSSETCFAIICGSSEQHKQYMYMLPSTATTLK